MNDSKPQIYKREDMLPVSKVRKMIPGKNGGPCSRQHVYNLIDLGNLKPVFKFGGKHCVCVPRPVVEEYIKSCEFDPAA
jgi:hypothetical protein